MVDRDIGNDKDKKKRKKIIKKTKKKKKKDKKDKRKKKRPQGSTHTHNNDHDHEVHEVIVLEEVEDPFEELEEVDFQVGHRHKKHGQDDDNDGDSEDEDDESETGRLIGGGFRMNINCLHLVSPYVCLVSPRDDYVSVQPKTTLNIATFDC